jgi:maltodextrin utilization protein YvdJ
MPSEVTAAITTVMYPKSHQMLGSLDTSDPDMADLINPHWKTFSKPSVSLNITFGVVCFILGIVGMIGNATVIFIFTKYAPF